MAIVVVDDIDQVIARNLKLAADVGLIERRAAVELAALAEAFEERLKANTPYGSRDEGDDTEHLRDTTAKDIIAVAGGADVVFRQTKTVTFKDGTVYPLWQLVEEGHEAPSGPIVPIDPSTGPKALFWPGAPEGHPWGSSKGGGAEPHPYVQQTIDEAAPEILAGARALAATGLGTVIVAWSRGEGVP